MKIRWWFAILCAWVLIVSSLPSGLGSAQGESQMPEGEYYEIGGYLLMLNMEKKEALIEGSLPTALTWGLIDDFSRNNIKSGKSVVKEFTRGRFGVKYYVIVADEPVNSGDLLGHTIAPTRIDLGPKDIREIHEKGGKIYKLEYIPQLD